MRCIGITKRVNINIKTNTTLEYLITVQHLLNVQKGKLDFIWLAKKDNLMLLDQFKTFSINLNAQHVNGMTPFDVRLLDTLPSLQKFCDVTVGEIWEAFSQLSDGEFEAKYGFAKPGLEQDMVLHCLKGKRALDASDKLSLLGYTKVKVYKGSFSEWKEKGGEVLTQ